MAGDVYANFWPPAPHCPTCGKCPTCGRPQFEFQILPTLPVFSERQIVRSEPFTFPFTVGEGVAPLTTGVDVPTHDGHGDDGRLLEGS